jgi:hypothetical protein
MDEEVLETIGREYIKRVMNTIFARIKETEGEKPLHEIVNDFDEYGCSLVHYMAAINYHEIIALL